MTETFYFKKRCEWTFDMTVTINDDRHRANFVASMGRKGFIQTDEAEYRKDCRERSLYSLMFRK